jgi:hypothetical protein
MNRKLLARLVAVAQEEPLAHHDLAPGLSLAEGALEGRPVATRDVVAAHGASTRAVARVAGSCAPASRLHRAAAQALPVDLLLAEAGGWGAAGATLDEAALSLACYRSRLGDGWRPWQERERALVAEALAELRALAEVTP